MPEVKTESARARRARATRTRMLDAARELFVTQGYGGTTLQEIATRAGVAVQTIYFTFGNKRSLFKELVDVTIAGDDAPVATLDRPWFRAALATETAADHLRAHVRGTGAVLARVAPITEMMNLAAATDADIATLWHYETDPRFIVQSTAANAMMTKPGARADVSASRAADVLYGILSTELYLLLVRERGWSVADWEHWAFETLRVQLCES
jgi:AcrR family transcriptional regulator